MTFARGRCLFLGVGLVVLSTLRVSAQDSRKPTPQPVQYTVSLAKASEHVVTVKIELTPGAEERTLQLPVWYALYQVRDFSQYVRAVRTASASVAIQMVNKSEWRVNGAGSGVEIDYEVFADTPGPFGAQLDSHHAFFNLAEILMYSVDTRESPIDIRFSDIPQGWRVGTTLFASASDFTAANYDELA
ncbi:MAG TPA: hypothetical protein VGN39_02855 [Terriglobales bacterium]|jgi:predicted metalloprotease with PDZ domain|nr:hypothetical protein [Terriglobales bacterium]